nr:reverse transcriptase domain-containing protein [Tanacetum cinerariifolium]
YTDHSALKYLFNKQDAKPRLVRWVPLLQGFNIEIKDKKGAENLLADHFSRLENPHMDILTDREIADEFPNEHLMMLKTKFNDDEPCIFKHAKEYVMKCDACQRSGNISSWSKMPQNNIQVKAQAFLTNDARVVVKFFRGLFTRFGVPKALISDKGQRIDEKFKPIYYTIKTLNITQEHYTTTEKELLAVVFAFSKFCPYVILSKTIGYTDHSALKYLFNKQDAKPRLVRWVPLLQGFNIEIKDKKGAENLLADHFSRLENPHMDILTDREIADEFPNEHLMMLKTKFNDDEPWYADFVNYMVGKVIPLKWTFQKRKIFYSQIKSYFWDEPYAFRLCSNNIMRKCAAGSEIFEILTHCHSRPTEGHHSASVTARKVYESGFYCSSIFKHAKEYVMKCDACQRSGNISSWSKMPQNNIQVKAQAFLTNDARVVVKFFRGLFTRFGVPKALISDKGTHVCNS